MLRVNQLVGFGSGSGGGGSQTLMQIITAQGLTSNLLFALDAGDAASYSGSGQVWTDTSGAGNHFNRGTTSGAEASDPTFSGVAGNLSENEYFSCDGGDFFTLAAGTFDDGWSKDLGEFTMGAIIMPFGGGNQSFFGNADSAADNGILLRMEGVPSSVGAYYDTANAVGHSSNLTAANTVASVPNLGIMGMKESTTTLKVKLNTNALESFTPGASALTTNPSTLTIGAFGGNQALPSGARIFAAFAWSTLQSDAAINALATALKSARFPSMP